MARSYPSCLDILFGPCEGHLLVGSYGTISQLRSKMRFGEAGAQNIPVQIGLIILENYSYPE